MNGIYHIDGTYESEQDVKRRLYLEGDHPTPEFIDPTSVTKDFHDYSTQFKQRQEERGDVYQTRAEIQLFDTSLITFQSDLHIGGEETDYARIEREAELIINTPNSYVVLMGDLLDNFFFAPPVHETLDVIPEQIQFARELIKYYADNNKLLAVWEGNHEMWSTRSGVRLYDYLLQDIDAYRFFGVGYLDTRIVDEMYAICGSHVLPGHSIYNKTHPQNRAVRFGGAWGADIVVGGHHHTKGIAQQPFIGYGGETVVTTMMALGTYKLSDGYVRNKAFTPKTPQSAYGASVILDKDGHRVLPYYDVVEAHRNFVG